MRDFNSLDPTSLRAFYFAAETLNFTQAAELAVLTQSGVSQHISKLEGQLNTDLFIRAGKKVLLTESGRQLKAYAEVYLDQVDGILEKLRQEGQELKGLVRYAMPDSCLMTPHFSMLLEDRVNFEGVDLQVTICESDKVLQKLLNSEIDFGFVTKTYSQNEIHLEEFAREEYILVGSRKNQLKLGNIEELKDLNFINYPGMDVLFEQWQSNQFTTKRKMQVSELNIRGEMNNLRGAITMCVHCVGLGVFPRHCVQENIENGQLVELKTPKKKNVENLISIVRLRHAAQSARVRRVLKAFWDMKP